MTPMRTRVAVALGVTSAAAVALATVLAPAAQAHAGPAAEPAPANAPAPAAGAVVPAPFSAADAAQARAAASTPDMMLTLTRFFARDGVVTPDAARPRLSGPTVTVYSLDPGFVAGRPGAPVADPQFLASKVVSADGQAASVWTVRGANGWKVVDIATGGDETDYVSRAHGAGTVFREPQIDAWYVVRDGRVLPLDPEARRTVGAGGVSLAAYQRIVHAAYGDKLPGSAYDRAGEGGGYGRQPAPQRVLRPAPEPRPAPGVPDAPGTPGAPAGAAVSSTADRSSSGGTASTAALTGIGIVSAVGLTAFSGGSRALRRRGTA